jgi:hypothetical protein
MGRRERPLDVTAGPLQEFAGELRALRRAAGSPTYKAMAARAFCSKSALAAAAQGDALPSLVVVLAYVQVCGGNITQWERRWIEFADRLDRESVVRASITMEASRQLADRERILRPDYAVSPTLAP